MTSTDRRSGRTRVRIVTTGLAVTSALGVAGVAGGLAVHAQGATATGGTTQSSGQSSSQSSSQSSNQSSSSGVSSGSTSTHATSSGS